MSTFLETLKERLAEAHKRMQETQTALAKAQAEHTAATNEFNTWNYSVTVETKRQATEAAVAALGKVVAEVTPHVATSLSVEAAAPAPNTEATEINKTELIRDLLRQNVGGMKPVEVWKAVKGQIPQRSYVYAVLGRLKNRDQVSVKRGKYYFRASVKPEEVKAQDHRSISIQ